MQEPSLTTLSTGTGLVAAATWALGPLLGEYAIIVGLGLLGTLIALSESVQTTWWRSLIFLVKGVTFSFVFTGLITTLLLKYVLPEGLGFTPYGIMGIVAFAIGWSSDRLGVVREAFLSLLTSIFSIGKRE